MTNETDQQGGAVLHQDKDISDLGEGEVFAVPEKYGDEWWFRVDERFIEADDSGEFMATVERGQSIGGWMNREFILTYQDGSAEITFSGLADSEEQVAEFSGPVEVRSA